MLLESMFLTVDYFDNDVLKIDFLVVDVLELDVLGARRIIQLITFPMII
jgi:hypothetical protein